MTIKELILKAVNTHQGIKTTDLVLDIMINLDIPSRQEFTDEVYEKALMELINEGEIVEVEYTLPSMDYRVKALYLPKGAVVEVSRKAS